MIKLFMSQKRYFEALNRTFAPFRAMRQNKAKKSQKHELRIPATAYKCTSIIQIFTKIIKIRKKLRRLINVIIMDTVMTKKDFGTNQELIFTIARRTSTTTCTASKWLGPNKINILIMTVLKNKK